MFVTYDNIGLITAEVLANIPGLKVLLTIVFKEQSTFNRKFLEEKKALEGKTLRSYAQSLVTVERHRYQAMLIRKSDLGPTPHLLQQILTGL